MSDRNVAWVCFLRSCLVLCAVSACWLLGGCEKGLRPYELRRDGRVVDDHVPLVDFEDMAGWSVEAVGGKAKISRSQGQLIWGEYTGKIAYTGDPNAGVDGAEFVIRPAEPIAIDEGFTEVNLWVWHDYWRWKKTDSGKPMGKLSVLLETVDGQEFKVPFSRDLDWPEWYLLHVRLNEKQCKAFANGGVFKGFHLSSLRDEEKLLYLDNLSFYKKELAGPVEYEILPRPNIELAEGQNLGVHTGKERLPFPTREETMLPVNLTEDFKTEVVRDGNAFVLRYKGDDGVVEYRYSPKVGDLGDMTVELVGKSGKVVPMDGGGVQFKLDDNVDGIVQERFGTFIYKKPFSHAPSAKDLIECKIVDDTVVSKWKISKGDQSAVVKYVFRLWQKSLVVDVHCKGGEVAKVSLGKVSGAVNPQLIDVPYWVGRPRVLLMGNRDKPAFMTSFVDHYRTGGSHLYFENKSDENDIYCGGGTYYIPRTDGKRNDCHERLFVTISPKFEEVLPEIPNPVSKWRDVAADYLVCYFEVKDRDKDYEHWKKIARYGMNKVIMLDWETCWRDKAESFTFRTDAAPGKGGDENLQEYIEKVQALGLRYALYNNYVDFAPVNSFWDEDLINRVPSGEWQQAWFRTYTPKPARAVKYSRELTQIMQDKFKPMAAGPDVHTAVSPYSRVDYDARMPGAGTMMSQFYSYGQILHEQQQIWDGPVYSECGNNYYYAGLTTGSGALDRTYNVLKQPLLVDFYLRKMQPISGHWSLGYDRTDIRSDGFYARTIAFGMPCGFMGGWRSEMDKYMVRGYYLLQQLQSSYCKALIKDIRYANAKGELLQTSEAIATGAIKRSQIRLEYDNGLMVWVNGHQKDMWETPDSVLPPFGFYATDSKGELVVFSAMKEGRRADYVRSEIYDFVDGRGEWVETRYGACDGQLIVLKKEDGSREVIPYEATKFAVAIDKMPVSVVALDIDGKQIGQTNGLFKNRLYNINEVKGAVSYLLKF